MTYVPFPSTLPRKKLLPADTRQSKVSQTNMSPEGINLRTLQQVMDPKFAINIENWLINDTGRLIKRKGLISIFSVAGTTPVTMLVKFTSDIFMFAYGTQLSAYTFSTNTITPVHTFSGAGAATGAVEGTYFFVCNGTERIAYVDAATLTYTLVADATAPMATVLYAAQGRLFAGQGSTVYWSAIDTGTGVPFNGGTDWTAGTSIANANNAVYQNAGNVEAFAQLGQQMVALYDSGKAGFRIQTLSVNNVQQQNTIVDFQRTDFGSARGAIYTQKGIFYANTQGIFQLESGGVTNQPYSGKDTPISLILGVDFFNEIDFTNADITYDLLHNILLVTCAENSTTNNLVLWYNLDTKAWGRITGWNISRFLTVGTTIYGASATGTNVYQLFYGSSDDGAPIRAEYVQEVQTGPLDYVKSLEQFKAQSRLSPSSCINIFLDIYDQFGVFTSAKRTLSWTSTGISDSSGFSAGMGELGWGDEGSADGLVNSIVQSKMCRINTLSRLIMRFIVFDTLPCEINWVQMHCDLKYPIRVNNISIDNLIYAGSIVESNSYVDSFGNLYDDQLGNIYTSQ